MVLSDGTGFLSATELARLIGIRELSSVEVVTWTLDRIDQADMAINAVCTLAPDAVEEARRADDRLQKGDASGPLHGIPVLIKDTFFTRNLRSTAGSALFADFVPDEDAAAVARLKAAGAIVVGKTNVPELAYTGHSSNALFGTTRNPWNLAYTPGGSSGGTAAAVAAGYCPFGLASDGGGSIRVPAAYCNVVGHKPTYGLVPLAPGFPGWDSLLSAGPIARTVTDAALMLDVLAGPDPRDRLSLPRPFGSVATAIGERPEVAGLRIAWAPRMGGAPVDSEVLAVTTAVAARFTELGAEVEETDVWPENPEQLFRIFFDTESAGYIGAHLEEARAAGVVQGLVQRAERALALTGADYAAAQAERRVLDGTVAAFFEKYDLLVTPTVTVPAFSADLTAPHELAPVIDGVAVSDLGRTPFCYPFNLTGSPACSIPAGFVSDNRPVGFQIVGPRLNDCDVLRAALAYEQAFPWTDMRPPL